MTRPVRRILAGAAVAVAAVLAVGGVTLAVRAATDPYRIQVVLPSALGIQPGSPVQLDGFDAGSVSALAVRDDHAVATVALPRGRAPLHEGTSVRVEWRSLLGEHVLRLQPGPAANAALPNGALIPAGSAQVTLEDVVQALDPPTRARLSSLLIQLRGTLDGHEADLGRTLATAGPAVQALGEVLAALGDDGPAIRGLLTDAQQVTGVLAARRAAVASTVSDLGTLSGAVATRQRQLSAGLTELPDTVAAVRRALDKVPAATDAAVPLLRRLRPAADQLPSVADKLRPVLTDLPGLLEDLRPTLEEAHVLLDRTPPLLDDAHTTVPAFTDATRTLSPAVAFLRPYTPDAMGFLSNWGNFFSNYNPTGHFARALFTVGQTALNNQPPVPPVGGLVDRAPAPGTAGGQPWTDAAGDGPR
jgi:phospholipid/cholesterol/gamma-HCH transport system substrate-binding protein